jgi:hypothetical protein
MDGRKTKGDAEPETKVISPRCKEIDELSQEIEKAEHADYSNPLEQVLTTGTS